MLELFEGQLDEDSGVGVLPAWIAWREKGPDVARGDGAQQRVSNGVQQHVAVGVPGQALGMVEQHAANAQRYARFERMRVPAKSDPCIHSWFACT